jgi:hypothetical protein
LRMKMGIPIVKILGATRPKEGIPMPSILGLFCLSRIWKTPSVGLA